MYPAFTRTGPDEPLTGTKPIYLYLRLSKYHKDKADAIERQWLDLTRKLASKSHLAEAGFIHGGTLPFGWRAGPRVVDEFGRSGVRLEPHPVEPPALKDAVDMGSGRGARGHIVNDLDNCTVENATVDLHFDAVWTGMDLSH